MRVSIKEVDVIAPNLKKTFSGVTSTIIHLVPLQRNLGCRIAVFGIGFPKRIPYLRLLDIFNLWKKPNYYPFRIWHARRNTEMILGIIMRDFLRMKIRIVFTSASQRYHKFFTKFLIRRMDRVIAVSKKSGFYLEVPHTVITHGINLDYFQPKKITNIFSQYFNSSTKYVVGCFGRIRFQKGTDLFVDVMIDLLPFYSNWIAVIAGRTTINNLLFLRKLKKKVSISNLSNRIIFLGEINDLRKYYNSLNLYVAPSRTEGFGLTPLEAMASQITVIASGVGMYPEILQDGAGKIFSANNKNSLRDAIEYYFSNPKKTIQDGKIGFQNVQKNFSIIREAQEINNIYKKILMNNLNI